MVVASYWVCLVSVFGEHVWTTYCGQRKSGVTVKDGGVLEVNAHSRWSFEGVTRCKASQKYPSFFPCDRVNTPITKHRPITEHHIVQELAYVG
jgi:hypothetical protein